MRLIVNDRKAFKGSEAVGRGMWTSISILNLEIPRGRVRDS